MENSAGTLQEKELAEEDFTPPLGISAFIIQLTFAFVRIGSSLSCYTVAFYPISGIYIRSMPN
jgi:hypothetical protein